MKFKLVLLFSIIIVGISLAFYFTEKDFVAEDHTIIQKDFEQKLETIDPDYNDNLTLVTGISDTKSDDYNYCAYAQLYDGNEYWYLASVHKSTITNSKIVDDVPICNSNDNTCFCKLLSKIKWQNG